MLLKSTNTLTYDGYWWQEINPTEFSKGSDTQALKEKIETLNLIKKISTIVAFHHLADIIFAQISLSDHLDPTTIGKLTSWIKKDYHAGGISIGPIVKEINRIYSDHTNKKIPLAFAYSLAVKKVKENISNLDLKHHLDFLKNILKNREAKKHSISHRPKKPMPPINLNSSI